MQLTKSISIITLSIILSLSAISTYANNDAEENKAADVKNITLTKIQSTSTLIMCDEYPLCDVDKIAKDDEWPQVSVDSQK